MATGTRATAVPVYLGQLVQFGSIITPTTFFDVFLPEGYSRCQFFFTGVTVSGTGDNVAAALYVAGNFECDPVHNDTYYTFRPPSTTLLGSLIILTPKQTDIAHSSGGYRAGCLVDLYVGDLQNYPVAVVDYGWGQASGGALLFEGQALTVVNDAATIPASRGPATLMRVLPLGNGNCNPPTSGETINTGDWRLYAYN